MPAVTARWYAAAVLLALAVAALVFWQLGTSASTTCVRSTADRLDGKRGLKGCDRDERHAIAGAMVRSASAPKLSTAVEVRSALIVWIALVAATAALAAFAAVRAVAMLAELKPVWDGRLILLSIGAVTLVALPLALFGTLAQFSFSRFGKFDKLHLAQLHWLTPLIAALMLPALIALVAVSRIVATRPELGLDALAALGARMRWLVGALGAFLSLAVLTTAARWQAIGTLPGGESVPGTVILLWGGVFALVLGIVYAPAYQLWAAKTGREIGAEVERQLGGDAPPGTPGYRAPELALRKELGAILGLGGAARSLQGSLAVLAPVIAAAVSSLFA